MLIRNTPMIATFIALAAFNGGATAADADIDVVETTAHRVANPDDVNRNLARRAHVAAVEEAVEALLAANESHLDIRIAGRTPGNTPDNTVASR